MTTTPIQVNVVCEGDCGQIRTGQVAWPKKGDTIGASTGRWIESLGWISQSMQGNRFYWCPDCWKKYQGHLP